MPIHEQIANKILTDPLWFHSEVLKRTYWQKQEEIILSVRDYKETAVASCITGGKSFVGGGLVHQWLLQHPNNSKVVTLAPTGRQNKEILWREVRASIVDGMYPKDAVQTTMINLTAQWFAIGLSTDEPLNIQGFHSPHLFVIIDEASGITDDIYDRVDFLKPEKILHMSNPTRNTGRFAEAMKSNAVNQIWIDGLETPNIKAGKLIMPGLLEQKDIDSLAKKHGIDSDIYRVAIRGQFPLKDSDTFISLNDVQEARVRINPDNNIPRKLGVDVAYFGDDLDALVTRQGNKIIDVRTYSKQDTMATTGCVIRAMQDNKVRPENIFIDVIGYGAGVCDRLKELKYNINPVNVANKANDSDRFANLRVELWDGTREWIKTGQIPNNKDWLELCYYKKLPPNSRGQEVLESKESIKNRGLSSPNLGDALAMTFLVAAKVVLPRIVSPQEIAPTRIGDYD